MIRRLLRLVMSGLITFLLTGVAVAEKETSRRLVVPSDEALAIMIKTTLIAYNDANLTGNYTVLRDLASPSFRETNSPARLAEIFQDMRRRKINIAPIVLFQPKLVQKPRIDEDGDLILEGFFDTRPERAEFFLVYREVDGLWRLFAIRVTTKRVEDAIAVPSATPSPAAAGQPEPKKNPSPAELDRAAPSVTTPKKTSSEKKASPAPAPAAGSPPDIRDNVDRLDTKSAPEAKPKPKESYNPLAPF